LIGVSFAAASAASAFAQSSAPGSTHPQPNKVAAVPTPPPPPSGPDKLTTQTGPRIPGGQITKPPEHSVVDDLAPSQKPTAAVKKYKCYSNCNIFVVMCEDMGGGASTEPDGAVVCTVYD
jgi:hypothetical protein